MSATPIRSAHPLTRWPSAWSDDPDYPDTIVEVHPLPDGRREVRFVRDDLRLQVAVEDDRELLDVLGRALTVLASARALDLIAEVAAELRLAGDPEPGTGPVAHRLAAWLSARTEGLIDQLDRRQEDEVDKRWPARTRPATAADEPKDQPR